MGRAKIDMGFRVTTTMGMYPFMEDLAKDGPAFCPGMVGEVVALREKYVVVGYMVDGLAYRVGLQHSMVRLAQV